jgi:hypothetical protein
MMKSAAYAFLLTLLVGAAAAFIRPAVPYQVVETVKPALSFSRDFTDADGLDNPNIESDTTISAARKVRTDD